MTTEIRQIAFLPSEVCAAIHDYRRRRGEPLPAGTITGVDFGDGPEVTVTLNIQNDAKGVAQVAVSAEATAAALILFCINRKIPLPAKAQKKLARIGSSIGLMIKQDMKAGI